MDATVDMPTDVAMDIVVRMVNMSMQFVCVKYVRGTCVLCVRGQNVDWDNDYVLEDIWMNWEYFRLIQKVSKRPLVLEIEAVYETGSRWNGGRIFYKKQVENYNMLEMFSIVDEMICDGIKVVGEAKQQVEAPRWLFEAVYLGEGFWEVWKPVKGDSGFYENARVVIHDEWVLEDHIDSRYGGKLSE